MPLEGINPLNEPPEPPKKPSEIASKDDAEASDWGHQKSSNKIFSPRSKSPVIIEDKLSSKRNKVSKNRHSSRKDVDEIIEVIEESDEKNSFAKNSRKRGSSRRSRSKRSSRRRASSSRSLSLSSESSVQEPEHYFILLLNSTFLLVFAIFRSQ